MTNPDHEASRPAFEAGYEPWAVKRVEEGWYEIASTESDWIEWCRAIDYAAQRAQQTCVWTGFSVHTRIHYKTCKGMLNYTEMPRLQFIPFCPGCGRKVEVKTTQPTP